MMIFLVSVAWSGCRLLTQYIPVVVLAGIWTEVCPAGTRHDFTGEPDGDTIIISEPCSLASPKFTLMVDPRLIIVGAMVMDEGSAVIFSTDALARFIL